MIVQHIFGVEMTPEYPPTKAANFQRDKLLANPKVKLKDQFHEVARFKHLSIRTVQDLLGHKDVTTTQIYTHVMQKPGIGVRSPLDAQI